MARSSNRVGMFSTNRGRTVKKGLKALGAAVVVVTLWNVFTAEPRTEDNSPTTSIVASDDDDDAPTVAAPIARPFALPIAGGVDQVSSGDIYGSALSEPEDPGDPTESPEGSDGNEDEGEEATDKLQRSDEYQSAVTLTKKFAEAYGTHSPKQGAQGWVDSLPGMEPKAEARLLKSAKSEWPQLVDRKSSSKAEVVSESVTPIYSRDRGERIQLSVSVMKETSYEGREGFRSEAYAVTLVKSSDERDGWAVVAVE